MYSVLYKIVVQTRLSQKVIEYRFIKINHFDILTSMKLKFYALSQSAIYVLSDWYHFDAHTLFCLVVNIFTL